jgi:hypothetical protein
VSVATHSGLPAYRYLLFQSHLWPAPGNARKATFACTGCYKTFDDAYGFLDHVFQKEVGSERSCQKRYTTTSWHFNSIYSESDPILVEKCLRNCMKREITRAKAARAVKKTKQKDEAPRMTMEEFNKMTSTTSLVIRSKA